MSSFRRQECSFELPVLFTDSQMADYRAPDPVRDLNNFLQEMPGGSLIKDFKWATTKEGPEHDKLYHVTAVCKHSFCDGVSHLFFQPFRTIQQSGVCTLVLDTALRWELRNGERLCRLSNT